MLAAHQPGALRLTDDEREKLPTDVMFEQTVAVLAERRLGGHPNPAIEGHLKSGQR
jgi:hypothetical protein